MAIVKKLLHTRYRVDDLETSVKFYTEILGLTETRRHKSPRGQSEQHPQKNAHKSHARSGCLRASSVRCALPWASPRHVAASAPSGRANAKGA